MTPFATLRASLVFPVGLMLALGHFCAVSVSATPHRAPFVDRATSQDAPGKALYLQYCKACHGVHGVPAKLMVKKYAKIPNLADSTFFEKRSEDSIVVVLNKGTGSAMKSFANKLSADEMLLVAKYVRTLGQAR